MFQSENSGREENSHAPPDSFSYRNMTEVERELRSIRGEKQLMEALFRDVEDIGWEKLDERSKIWVEQLQEVALHNILEWKTRFNIVDKITKIGHKIQDVSRSIKAYMVYFNVNLGVSCCGTLKHYVQRRKSFILKNKESWDLMKTQKRRWTSYF
ncbi:hypothetical protein V8G54_028749 [Vigna mungo]|uniref:Uncharacterized protein n=1 Tax=Vigna mungo TaxID=3915 RepID=A0AAQ3RL50_VIGMU